MDAGLQSNRKPNPKAKSNLFSVIIFFYNYKLVKEGRKKELEDEDIYETLPQFRATNLGDKLEKNWKKGDKLWKTLIKCCGLTYFIYALAQLAFGTVIIFYEPKLIAKFISLFQSGQNDVREFDKYLYAIAIVALLQIKSLFTNNLMMLVIEYSLKVRTAVCSLIFRKSLKIRSDTFGDITIGRTLTLITKDVFAIDAALTFIKDLFIGILYLVMITCLLYQRVGSSTFPFMTVLLTVLPIQFCCGMLVARYRLKTAKRSDERFKLSQEVLSSIKIIKMYAWEKYFEKMIGSARLAEINQLTIVYYLKALIGWLGALVSYISLFVILVTYILHGSSLDASTVYYVQQCLAAIKTSIMVSIPMGVCNIADLKTSFKRIQEFLDAPEIFANYHPATPSNPARIYLDQVQVDVKNKEVLKSASLSLNSGLLLLTGKLGSGKSVLLKTILGEFSVKSGTVDVSGTISYAPETPWLFPSTIKQNILFGEPYHSKRYQEVLKACALTYDISLFEKLDETVVGDQGVNLSAGQKARISLARAIYKESDIYLLDDCLSALDNNVSDHIFQNCYKIFLKDKICIFVTNKVHLVTQISNVLFLENGSTLTLEEQTGGLDKRITYFIDDEDHIRERKVRESIANIDHIAEEQEYFQESDYLLVEKEHRTEIVNIYKEHKTRGKVKFNNYLEYFSIAGGGMLLTYLFIVFAIAQATLSCSDKLLSIWVTVEPQISRYNTLNQTSSDEYVDVLNKRNLYMKLYTIFVVCCLVVSLIRSTSLFYAFLRAAKNLHQKMFMALTEASMTFYDNHFIGNIINRLSKDLYVIDEYMPFLIFDIFRMIFQFVSVIVLVVTVNWIFLIVGSLLVVKLFFVQRYYLPTGRSLRRLEATTKSPIIGYLNSTLEGLEIIRSSRMQKQILFEFDRHQDHYTSAYHMYQTSLRFFIFLLDIFSTFFVAAVLLKFIFFFGGETAGDVGLALTQALTLSGIIEHVFRQSTELETVMTSIERILEYCRAEQEKKNGDALLNWPLDGHVKFQDVSLSYKNGRRKTLNQVQLDIPGGSTIGIIGRTGSGKSSIVAALFRLYDFEGNIIIDDEDITTLSLNHLRTNITLIPQDPVLFSGTFRTNIDPFDQYSDEQIYNALEIVGMKHRILSLNSRVEPSSYSSGEKQLICLARALIKKNRIIVLDEATANVDQETDLELQRTLQNCFKKCTVIIISHRLHSVIWCDKVATLKDGCLIEFDKPMVLLKNKRGILYNMIREENFETFVRLTHI